MMVGEKGQARKLWSTGGRRQRNWKARWGAGRFICTETRISKNHGQIVWERNSTPEAKCFKSSGGVIE